MKRLGVGSAALALIGLAVPAGAQNGATWIDARGRMVSVAFAGSGEAPAPADRPPAEMAALFKRLCLDSGGGEEGLAQAAAAAGLTGKPFAVLNSRVNMNETVPVVVWTGDGLAAARTDGFLGVGEAQCSATFYVPTPPDKSAVTGALSEVLGVQPSNLSAATDKKGKPKSNYAPEWTMAGPSGPLIVTAMVIKGINVPETQVQLSVRASKKPAKQG
ncbi:MAG TPA: hypothetical protein VD846_10985 [Allosphingosinicella sp.]|nr:hypothetical protein [Allosphingosinicella sp.]